MIQILLESSSVNKQYFALIDDEDKEAVLKHGPWKLKVQIGAKSFYAYSNSVLIGRQVLLHRFILGLKSSKIKTEHKNKNGLDCQKSNLRILNSEAIPIKELIVKRKRKTGVKWLVRKKKWSAHINFRGFVVNLGLFDEREKAISLRDKKYEELREHEFGTGYSTWVALLNEEIDSKIKAERKLARSRRAGKERKGLKGEARPVVRRAFEWP